MSVTRTILKKIFPRTFLKGAYGIYNRIKIATIDKIVFPEQQVKSTDFLIYRNGYPFRENEVKTDNIKDPRVKKFMDRWYDWTQEEFILVWDRPCVIEPVNGWAIIPDRKLLYYSLGISRTWFLARPSLVDYASRENDMVVEKAISFRDTGEENYFHFFNDVLAKYFFLKANGVSFDDRQVIVSRKLYSKTYFQWYLSQSQEFQKIKWIIQGPEYIATKSVVFCKPLTHRKDLFKEIFKPVLINTRGSKRIFVNRQKLRLRFISNFNDVSGILSKYDIEIVDPDMLAPAVQRTIFSQASLIVGVHGAGLANLYYRNGDCSVLEIFPPPSDDYLAFHYIMLAEMKGFRYQAMIGEGRNLGADGGFPVDAAKLDAMIAGII